MMNCLCSLCKLYLRVSDSNLAGGVSIPHSLILLTGVTDRFHFTLCSTESCFAISACVIPCSQVYTYRDHYACNYVVFFVCKHCVFFYLNPVHIQALYCVTRMYLSISVH